MNKIKILKMVRKKGGKWFHISPQEVEEDSLDGVVLLTESKRRFKIVEITP